eukprot:6077657-Prymnesium_polylepis.1
MHVRRLLEAGSPPPPRLFDANWAKQAWVAVSTSRGAVDPALAASRAAQLALQGTGAPPVVSAARIDQLLKSSADQFVATASTSLWLHFRKHVRRVVDGRMALTDEQYSALATEQRKALKVRRLRVAHDVCRNAATEDYKSTAESGDRPLVDAMRAWLELDALDWGDKPLEWHAKAAPLCFLRPTWRMLRELKRNGRRGFSLLPLRRSLVARYALIDTKLLRGVLGLGDSEQSKAMKTAAAEKRKGLSPSDPEYGKRAPRRPPDELAEDHWEAWDAVFDFRAALRHELCGLHTSNRRGLAFGFSMRTDGVGCSLNFTLPKPPPQPQQQQRKRTRDGAAASSSLEETAASQLTEMPKRGVWAVDMLKHLYRLGPPPRVQPSGCGGCGGCGGGGGGGSPQAVAAALDMHLGAIQVIGVDPGKIELAVASDPALAARGGKIRT